ncbi:peroxiredoxin Q [Conidiobolus coronatus NRRL 28638]|uniref:thioredoxin-dependent peroxiredoxin n=1 Tax=Conidiobolus coronatus (strain ATCC 28846 / CBS 209.66 / NRRL 28638) TaxID=796925 RepID=A0A137P6S5_CONC2|nr:peroxiredoxin Q [Conidiobolus coronatus NRRL 28638]|eukprot:KXN70669.1 peroxiredoxin Q [Conidiobolus coronatus NRRL 28638]
MLPSFSLKNHKDKTIDLAKLLKTNGIVIFVYPRASTPGCTNQVCFFRDSLTEFESLGYKVFGLSNDPPKKNNTFATKQNLTYDLLCDEKEEFLKFIGAKNGTKVTRSCIVIQKGGKILDKSIKVGPIQSLEWALDAIKKN